MMAHVRFALCRHCEKKKITRPRGLCWNCWHDRGIRSLYPITAKQCLWSPFNGNRASPIPDDPTDAMPGSAMKILVMTERIQAGFSAFHPQDA